MLGHIPARDLPALAVILACAVVERVVESRWCRRAALAAAGLAVAWLVGG